MFVYKGIWSKLYHEAVSMVLYKAATVCGEEGERRLLKLSDP